MADNVYMAYCVKCREKKEMRETKLEVSDKGRKMARGYCPVCGTKMTLFLPKDFKMA